MNPLDEIVEHLDVMRSRLYRMREVRNYRRVVEPMYESMVRHLPDELATVRKEHLEWLEVFDSVYPRQYESPADTIPGKSGRSGRGL